MAAAPLPLQTPCELRFSANPPVPSSTRRGEPSPTLELWPAAQADGAPCPELFAHLVVALRLHQLVLVLRRELRPVDGQGNLVDLAGEHERHLVVTIVHRRAGVGADVEVLVPGEDQWDGPLHRLACDFLAVYLQHTGAAPTDSAQAVERQRPHPEAVVLEVEFERVPAGRKRLRSLPPDPFQ